MYRRLRSFIEISPYVFPTFALITWVMGPILMLIGFYVKAETDAPSTIKTNLDQYDEAQLLKSKQEQKKTERPS